MGCTIHPILDMGDSAMQTFRGTGLIAAALLLAPAALAQAQDQDGTKKDQMAPHAMLMSSSGHATSGTVSVVTDMGKRRLRLGDDFRTDDKDVVVLLSSTGMKSPGAVELGKLRKASGTQSFDIPASADLAMNTQVVLWSGKNGKAVAVADLAGGAMKHKMDAMHDHMDMMPDSAMQKDKMKDDAMTGQKP
jgi:hypothetical protein